MGEELFALNDSATVYHRQDCPSAKFAEKFVPLDEIPPGAKPCGRCNPKTAREPGQATDVFAEDAQNVPGTETRTEPTENPPAEPAAERSEPPETGNEPPPAPPPPPPEEQQEDPEEDEPEEDEPEEDVKKWICTSGHRVGKKYFRAGEIVESEYAPGTYFRKI